MQGPFRLLWLTLAASLVALTSLKIGLWLREPALYSGDRTELRDCRQCKGKGNDADLAREVPEMGDRCAFCRGSGKVKVLFPGPNHPVRIVGVLVEEAKTDPEDGYWKWAIDRTRQSNPMSPEPRPGVIAEGRVRFEGKVVEEIKTGVHGLITAELPPGTYTVVASKDGYQETRGQLVVERLTEPIWMEAANLVTPPENAADERGRFGIPMLVTLGKKDAGPGRFLLNAGMRAMPGYDEGVESAESSESTGSESTSFPE